MLIQIYFIDVNNKTKQNKSEQHERTQEMANTEKMYI